MDTDGLQTRAPRRHVVVIGGGLAGLSAACELAGHGHRVTLLEKRPYLGGKVYSYAGTEEYGPVDNGQHIFLQCCTSYIAFLKKLGVLGRTQMQASLCIPVFGADGQRSDLARTDLPSPLHLAHALARYRHLSAREKAAVLPTILAMHLVAPEQRAMLDGQSFYAWLVNHGQSDRAITNLWDLIVLPTLNVDSRHASAGQAIMLFQEAFLKGREAADIGVSTVGLSELCYKEACAYIETRGGSVILAANVQGIEGSVKGITCARLHGGSMVSAESYILAVPPREMLAVLPPDAAAQPFFSRAFNLKTSPIANLHLWMDRTVTDLPFAAYLGSHVQWVFATAHSQGLRQHLVVSVSGARDYAGMSKDALIALLVEDLRKRLPLMADARMCHSVLIWERDATFTPEPGSAAWRLPTKTPVHNLFIAGAWTDTGWPATMESAVRSGVFAAREVEKNQWTMP